MLLVFFLYLFLLLIYCSLLVGGGSLSMSLNYLGNPPLVQLIILSILYLYFEIELN